MFLIGERSEHLRSTLPRSPEYPIMRLLRLKGRRSKTTSGFSSTRTGCSAGRNAFEHNLKSTKCIASRRGELPSALMVPLATSAAPSGSGETSTHGGLTFATSNSTPISPTILHQKSASKKANRINGRPVMQISQGPEMWSSAQPVPKCAAAGTIDNPTEGISDGVCLEIYQAWGWPYDSGLLQRHNLDTHNNSQS
jgi:hypothetical protein